MSEVERHALAWRPQALVSEACSETDHTDFAEPVYLKLDFLKDAKFNSQFDRPELSWSKALGARLMNAFCQDNVLKKATHTDALEHVVRQVCLHSMPDTVVPIVVHCDEHEAFITGRNEAFRNDDGECFFVSMLRQLGYGTTDGSMGGLGTLRQAGH
jgi:hypothetical protein